MIDLDRRLLALEAHYGLAGLDPEFEVPKPELIRLESTNPLTVTVLQPGDPDPPPAASVDAAIDGAISPAAWAGRVRRLVVDLRAGVGPPSELLARAAGDASQTHRAPRTATQSDPEAQTSTPVYSAAPAASTTGDTPCDALRLPTPDPTDPSPPGDPKTPGAANGGPWASGGGTIFSGNLPC